MKNNDLIAYLAKFEKFNIAKIQRYLKLGYPNAISKITELYDTGLIYELPDEPMSFRVSNSRIHSSEPLSDIFQQTLQPKEPFLEKGKYKKVRVWFEPINNHLRFPTKNKNHDAISKILHLNSSEKIIFINTPVKPQEITVKNNNIKITHTPYGLKAASVAIINIDFIGHIKHIKMAMRYDIQKIYILGDKESLFKQKRNIKNIFKASPGVRIVVA